MCTNYRKVPSVIYMANILRVSCKFFHEHLGENSANATREKCRNTNSAASSWCHPHPKIITRPSKRLLFTRISTLQVGSSKI